MVEVYIALYSKSELARGLAIDLTVVVEALNML